MSSVRTRRMNRSKTLAVALAAFAGIPAARSFSADPPARKPAVLTDQPNQVTGNEITPAQKEAVDKGLAWMARQLAESSAGRRGGFGGFYNHAGITALGGLAFMQAGHLPGRGKYGKEVQHCLDYVLASCRKDGLIASDSSQGPMYGHGFATLFLGEIYGMTGNEEVKEKLQRAVTLIQKTQNAEGGWRYQPAPYDADISVTICEVMALRAARDAGIKVEKEVIDKAVSYVRRCQNPDGGFNYMAGQGAGGSAFPRSAAGVSALYYAGIFEGDDIERGLKYLKNFTPGKGNRGNEGHYFYGHYYAVQANFLAGGAWWANWYPAIRDELIRTQDKSSGAWTGDFSEDYATSMALIILQMPNRYLPVYSGKGPGS
jgi:hypothetical protein